MEKDRSTLQLGTARIRRIYLRSLYTIKGERPSDETGIYRYKFESPATTSGERIKIFFDGVMTDTEVFINGKPAGEMHQGGFYRFSYDITDLLKPGKKNLLEVKIAKESANKSINAAERKADWWLYGGIYRPVWLEVVPAVHMRHFILNADQHGKLQAAIEMEGDAKGYELSVSVRSLKDGKTYTLKKTNLAFLIRLRIRTRNSWWKGTG